MLLPWFWAPLGALAILVLFPQSRIYRIHRGVADESRVVPDRDRERRRQDRFDRRQRTTAVQQSSLQADLGLLCGGVGETFAFEQIHPDDRFKVLDAAREARQTGIGTCLEYRIKHKDGSWRVLESVASTIRNAKGEVAKLVIVNRDITMRNRLPRRARKEQAHSSQRRPKTESRARSKAAERSVRSTRTLLTCAVSRGDDSSILCCAA